MSWHKNKRMAIGLLLCATGCNDTVFTALHWCEQDLEDPRCDPETRRQYCKFSPNEPKCRENGDGGFDTSDSAISAVDDAAMPGDGPEGGAEACIPISWYADDDGDGDGDPANTKTACTQPTGYVDNAGDLDPGCGRQKPSAGCTPDSVRCVDSTVGDRETCTEDALFPGCTDWRTSTSCAASAPVCSGNGACGKCTQDSDCSGLAGTKVCDDSAGACVQCTGAKASACGGDVCDSLKRRCAMGVKPASADLCETCVSDAQCGETKPALCMPTSFNGTNTGYACLPKVVAAETCIDDHRPYVSALNSGVGDPIASIDGPSVPVCELALTTCGGLADFRKKPCNGGGDGATCGATSLDDGICAPVPGQSAFRCSVPCVSDDDCKVGSSCTGGGYCSL